MNVEHTGRDLAVLIPLWRRTRHIERVHTAFRATVPDARIVFVVSDGDPDCAHAAHLFGDELPRTLVVDVDGPGGVRGDYARKINVGYRATDEPWLFTAADDLDPHPGWYDRALAQGTQLLKITGTAGEFLLRPAPVIGTNDLTNDRTMKGQHSTHTLVARWYADCCAVVDQPGAIYSERYGHEWCDDELVGTARRRGAYAHALDAHVEHLHPLGGKAPDDDTYRRGRLHTGYSRAQFNRRRRLWGRL